MAKDELKNSHKFGMSERRSTMVTKGQLEFASLNVPPHARGSGTSRAAALMVAPHAATMRDRVYALISARGRYGATTDEVEEALDMKHQTASARVCELARTTPPRIRKNGERLTRSGARAVVWVANV